MAKGTPRERVSWIEVEGERLPAWIERGQVQVELPFDVDLVRLAEILREEGYFYAHHPERVDAQGWGRQMDYEGYYPYWLFREGLSGGPAPGRTIFACPPEDYRPAPAHRPEPGRAPPRAEPPGRADEEVAGEPGAVEPFVGPAAVAEIRRWVPLLKRARRAPDS